MNDRAAGFDAADKIPEVGVEVVDGLPLYFRGGLPRGLPVLEGGFSLVALRFIFAQSGLDEENDAASRG